MGVIARTSIFGFLLVLISTGTAAVAGSLFQPGDILLLGSAGSPEIIQVDPTTQQATPLVSLSSLTAPRGMTFGPDGSVLLTNNEPTTTQIVRVDPNSGQLTTLASLAGGETNGPLFFGAAAEGNALYVGATGAPIGTPGSVISFDLSTSQSTTTTTGGYLNTPNIEAVPYLTIETNQTLLVANSANSTVFRVNVTGGAQQLLASGTPVDGAQDVAIRGGVPYVAANNVGVVELGAGGPTLVSPGPLMRATSIAVLPDGTLVVAELGGYGDCVSASVGGCVELLDPTTGARQQIYQTPDAIFDIAVVPVPEPSSVSLLAIGVLILIVRGRSMADEGLGR